MNQAGAVWLRAVSEPVAAAPADHARDWLPVQRRARERMLGVLQVAEQMLVLLGPEQISIPRVAQAAGVPRATIYACFADKYALFCCLTERHLGRLAERVSGLGELGRARPWQDHVRWLVNGIADYCQANPVVAVLVLGGPYSRAGGLVQASMQEVIAERLRQALAGLREPLRLPERPDATLHAVGTAFALMRHDYCRNGRISESTRQAVVEAVIFCLQGWQAGR
ncbi:TetR/AcrR family transcriptional regulator [Amnimonas aquatica]|uniref:TetR/AcrR family transcriptional regulator n=1 Tax=Amnimonas aquatica TaxID=2094561 RepID=A0A2P6ASG4_9GAMM|nr:TetR/AcrR family transcriptional regulator [Amnimonas aquatica]